MILFFKRMWKSDRIKAINSCRNSLWSSRMNRWIFCSKTSYALDDNEREILKRERRRLQEQLRRVKRNEARYHQYEKQQMLLRIQQENLALLHSQAALSSSVSHSPITSSSNFQLSLSDEDDDWSDTKHVDIVFIFILRLLAISMSSTWSRQKNMSAKEKCLSIDEWFLIAKSCCRERSCFVHLYKSYSMPIVKSTLRCLVTKEMIKFVFNTFSFSFSFTKPWSLHVFRQGW